MKRAGALIHGFANAAVKSAETKALLKAQPKLAVNSARSISNTMPTPVSATPSTYNVAQPMVEPEPEVTCSHVVYKGK